MNSNDILYHIVYKTTNLINKKIYIGIHTAKTLMDEYIGSGTDLQKDIKKIGKENFKRENLYICESREKALEIEKNIVDYNFLKRKDTYNKILGGFGGNLHVVTCRHKDDNSKNPKYIQLKNNDPMYLNGEWIHNRKFKKQNNKRINMVLVEDKNGKRFLIHKNDPMYLNGSVIPFSRNKITVFDIKTNKTFKVDKNDKRILSGELQIKKIKKTKNTYKYQHNLTKEIKFLAKDDINVLNGIYIKFNIEKKIKTKSFFNIKTKKIISIKENKIPKELSNELVPLNETIKMKNGERILKKDFIYIKKSKKILAYDNETLTKKSRVYKNDENIKNGNLILAKDTILLYNEKMESKRFLKKDRYLIKDYFHINHFYKIMKDNDGNIIRIHKNDSKIINNNLIGITKNKVLCYNENNKLIYKDKNDKKIINHLSNKTTYIDFLGNKYFLNKNDKLIIEKKLIGITSKKINFIDLKGNIFFEYPNHPNFLNGKWKKYYG
jgi:hypothetical protein